MAHYKPIDAYIVTDVETTSKKIEVAEVENMVYNPNEFKERKTERGKIVDDEVSEIQEGKLRDFISNWEKFEEKSKNADPNEEYIKVSCTTGANVLISVKYKEYSIRSKMARWVKMYGKPPHVGQKVKCMLSDRGFFNVLLPQ